MKLFVLASVLSFFLKRIYTSKNNEFEAIDNELVHRVERLQIGIESLKKNEQSTSQFIDSESRIEFKEQGNNLTFKLGLVEKTLDVFLSKELSKKVFIGNEILVLVLQAFEKWLNNRDDPPSSFNAYIKFYDSKMSPEIQGSVADTFRTRSILNLVKLAQELELYTLWAVAIYPMNIPPVLEMCDSIFAFIKHLDEASYQDYHVESLKIVGCFKDMDRLVKELPVDFIQLLHKSGSLSELLLPKEVFEAFIYANDLEKFKVLSCSSPGFIH